MISCQNRHLLYSKTQKVSYFKQLRFNTRDVRLKRNLFIYAKYFQWFSRCLSAFVATWGNTKDCFQFNKLFSKVLKKKNIFFFITGQQSSFFNFLARSFVNTTGLLCVSLPWNPLFFFYSFKCIQDRTPEFFPVFFIDPALLHNTVFKQNFFALFIKWPVFLVGDLNVLVTAKVFREVLFYKRVYPLFIPAGYGLYIFVFWLRFLFKII